MPIFAHILLTNSLEICSLLLPVGNHLKSCFCEHFFLVLDIWIKHDLYHCPIKQCLNIPTTTKLLVNTGHVTVGITILKNDIVSTANWFSIEIAHCFNRSVKVLVDIFGGLAQISDVARCLHCPKLFYLFRCCCNKIFQ